jgi:hypothetical protein
MGRESSISNHPINQTAQKMISQFSEDDIEPKIVDETNQDRVFIHAKGK